MKRVFINDLNGWLFKHVYEWKSQPITYSELYVFRSIVIYKNESITVIRG